MRRFLITIFLASALVLQLPVGYAQRKTAKTGKPTAASVAAQRSTNVISAAQLRDYLSFIAADEMEGRDTPSRGLDTVARFLAMNLSRWGHKPAGDEGSYFQRIALRRDRVDATQTRVEVNGRALMLGEDYIPAPIAGSASGQLVFAGNGWLIKSKNIDAYKDIDARGKIAVVFAAPNSFPRGLRRSDLAGKHGEDWMRVSEYASKQGVAGIIYVPDFQYLAYWNRTRQRILERGSTLVEKFQAQTAARIPSVTISPELANSLFQGEKAQATPIFEQMNGDGQIPASFELKPDKKFSINIVVNNENVGTQNVVAVWEGSDPVLKNEYVALGAHYDHVGVSAQQRGDSIFNGADDDGSGTTALLAMAEALSHATMRPKRSILFVWHAGEEKGLWGSRYFTEYPTVPLDRIVAQLNIDMIGRSKQAGDTDPRNKELSGPNDIYVIGSKMMSTELGELSEMVNSSFLNLNYNYRYDDIRDPNRFFSRSDHYSYARKGIPIIFYFDGVHEDYHQPGDSPDKIDYQKMEKVTQTIYMTLWEVANRSVRPKVDKQLPPELTRE
jgi:Zn-dependent M28 family amino/carboxypeptidase